MNNMILENVISNIRDSSEYCSLGSVAAKDGKICRTSFAADTFFTKITT